MTNTQPGGMFSKLINADTARPKTIQAVKPHEPVTMPAAGEEQTGLVHSPPVSPVKAKQSTQPLTEHGENTATKRKQISAYLTHRQLDLLKQLYFQLNAGEAQVEKSEIIGLGVELLSSLVDTQVLKYSGIQQVRDHLSAQVSKLLGTRIAKHPST